MQLCSGSSRGVSRVDGGCAEGPAGRVWSERSSSSNADGRSPPCAGPSSGHLGATTRSSPAGLSAAAAAAATIVQDTGTLRRSQRLQRPLQAPAAAAGHAVRHTPLQESSTVSSQLLQWGRMFHHTSTGCWERGRNSSTRGMSTTFLSFRSVSITCCLSMARCTSRTC